MKRPLIVDTDALTLDSAPTSPENYATLFAQRDVWGGGDGDRITFYQGRILHQYGDTWDGSSNRMARNSLIIQEGNRCHALWGIGPNGTRDTALPSSKTGTWLWPTGAVERDGIVQLIMQRMTPAAPSWRCEGCDVVTLDLRGDPTVISSVPAMVDQSIRWSGFVVDDDPAGNIYVCGTRGLAAQYLAATTFDGLTTEPWELWAGDHWTARSAEAKPIPVVGAGTFSHFFACHQPDGTWLLSGKTLDGFTDDITIWTAPDLRGPYTNRGRAATIGDAEWKTYSARVQYLPGCDGPVAIWSQSRKDSTTWPTLEQKHLYGPCFGTPDLTAINPAPKPAAA